MTALVNYVLDNPAGKAIYVHSGSVYSALLIGASSPKQVQVIIAHDNPHRYAIVTSYLFSNIKDKLLEETEAQQ